MKKIKKIIAIMLAISILFCGAPVAFAEEPSAFENSLARVNAAIDYLNAEYLTSELGNEFEYGTLKDKEELQDLATYITAGCSSDLEKANAIYDWMHANVDYSYSYYTAIDVFRHLSGICSGHAQLFSTLCKLSGIDCAIIRGYKADTTYVDMTYLYKNGYNKLHEWCMAYCDGTWLLYDDLWDYKAISDINIMARWYFLLHVDGIVPSTSVMDLKIDGSKSETYYDDGSFLCYRKGSPSTNYSSSVLQIGGCLKYDKYYYWDGFNSYYTYLGDGTNSIEGRSILGGYYIKSNSYLLRFKENGAIYCYTTIANDDNLYLTNFGQSVKITEDIDDNGLSNGNLNMYIGQSISISDFYPGANYSVISSKNCVEIIDGNIVATNVGKAEVRINNGNEVSLYIEVNDGINESNELFQEFCEHEHTHNINNEEYCDYCGKLIEVETQIIDGPIEEPIETPTEEPIIEEPIIEQIVNEELTSDVTENDLSVEKPVVEETIEQPEEIAPIEESVAELPEESIIEQLIEEPTPEVAEIDQNEVIEEQVEYIEQEQVKEPTIIQINIELPEEIDSNETVKNIVLDLISNLIQLVLQAVTSLLGVI